MNNNAIEIINAIANDLLTKTNNETAAEEFVNDVITGKEEEIDVGLQTDEAEASSDKAEEVQPVKKFKSSRQDLSVRTYLNRFKSGDIKIPECQRMFVWTDAQVAELMESIRANVSITELKLGEVDGVNYLADGLQRTTALMMLADSKKLSEEDKKILMSYKVLVTTTHDMDWESFNKWFYRCNNGTALASSVKECAKLSPELHDVVMELSGESFFREAPSKKQFTKNDQKRIIAMYMLASAAELTPSAVAGKLANSLSEAESLVIKNKDVAKEYLNVVIEALGQLKNEFVEKALTANYVCPWGIVFNQFTNVSAEEIAEVTMKVFEGKKPLPAYSATLRGSAASKESIKRRAALYGELLQKLRKEREAEWNSNVA